MSVKLYTPDALNLYWEDESCTLKVWKEGHPFVVWYIQNDTNESSDYYMLPPLRGPLSISTIKNRGNNHE